MTAAHQVVESFAEQVKVIENAPHLAGRPKRMSKERPKHGVAVGPCPDKDPTKTDDVQDGQKGPPLVLPLDRMNTKERRLMVVFKEAGPRVVLTIEQLSRAAFSDQKAERANSWTRNSLRRLVRGQWLEPVDRGSFTLTAYGVKHLRGAQADVA